MLKEKKIEIVEYVINLINDPDKWTTKVFAVDKNNKTCSYISPDACKWCAEGAFLKYNTDIVDDLIVEINSFLIKNGYQKLTIINDQKGRESVIDVLKLYCESL
jgi:hypothetical protein